MPTMKDVAARAGVSTATVSRALNRDGNGVKDATHSKVLEAVRELGYHPNHLPRNLRFSTSRTLGLVISDINNPFFPAVARGCEDVAQRHGYTVVLSNTDESSDREVTALRTMAAERAAGVMVASTGTTNEGVRALSDMGIPVVALDRFIEGIDVDSVTVDNLGGAYEAVSHLAALGHERIAMISGPQMASSIRARQAGYEKAIGVHGLTGHDLVRRGDLRTEGGRRATLEVLDISQPPTAIFSVNNQTTVGVLSALSERGLRIPDDISVIGFDDLATAELLDPPLSVVDQPAYELGERGAELLLRRVENPAVPIEQLVLRPSLVLRASTDSPGPTP